MKAKRTINPDDSVERMKKRGFDNPGHTTQTIGANGTSAARAVNLIWMLGKLPAAMAAVHPTTGNQTTTWIYGTTFSDCGVARNRVRAMLASDEPDADKASRRPSTFWASHMHVAES